ncbi:type VII secretion target [Actinoplanes sp. NPDC023936]|uniref:type VII secretion target n=1 Tax=Actinoplanes sp. NPDC023936 TaxID=3154910 RepID=UPI0033DBBB03
MALPSSEEVSVATDALRAEATVWEAQGGKLNVLSVQVETMEFGRVEAGLFQIMVSPYNEVVRAVTSRCAEGAAAMTEMASTLRQVADVYEAEDQANAHRIRNVY